MQLFADELTNQNREYYKVNDNVFYLFILDQKCQNSRAISYQCLTGFCHTKLQILSEVYYRCVCKNVKNILLLCTGQMIFHTFTRKCHFERFRKELHRDICIFFMPINIFITSVITCTFNMIEVKVTY